MNQDIYSQKLFTPVKRRIIRTEKIKIDSSKHVRQIVMKVVRSEQGYQITKLSFVYDDKTQVSSLLYQPQGMTITQDIPEHL